jgi:ABC-type nitrate/sulfonate/bicarbonate transport system substrate-binding protein
MRLDAPPTAAGRRCFLAAAFSLALCGSATALARDKLVVSFQPEIYAADLLIAVEEGYFEAQGLDVEVVAWSNSTAMLPALAHG